MHAVVKWVEGFQFVGESGSGHAIVMDAGKDSGGGGTGVSPMELLMLGIGGCSGMDVISILKKKKQKVYDLKVNVTGRLAPEYPKRYTEMNLEFVVTGKDIDESAVKRAIDLSMDKYCSVKATLEGSAKVSYTYKILEMSE